MPEGVSDADVALAERLTDLAREALTSQRHEAFSIKEDVSPVTAVNRAVEAAMRAEIARSAPTHGLIGEEYGAENEECNWVWILDPIDGTRQFAEGLPNFGMPIALCHRQVPALGVIAHPWMAMTCIVIQGREQASTAGPFAPVTCNARTRYRLPIRSRRF
ncbi:MAG: inositol monophosphatase family protein [Pseudomonadota bacterium]